MCIFGCVRKSNDMKYALGNSAPYKPHDCKQCTNLISKIYYSITKIFRFCGKYSLSLITKDYPLQYQLIELGQEHQYIVCKQCKRKFELKIKNKEIFVYDFDCSHSGKVIGKPCFCCRKITQRKSYKKCKKCGNQLLFLNQQYRIVECPKCFLQSCEFCIREETLFSTSYCHCKVQSTQKQLKTCKYLLLFYALLIIFILIGGHIIEQNQYWGKIECTLIMYFYKKECTKEQFIESLKLAGKVGVLTMILTPLPILLIEEIKRFFKLENRLQRALSFMARNYIRRRLSNRLI